MRRLAMIAVVVLLVLGAGGWWLGQEWQAPGPLPAAQAVVVPRGSLANVAAALQRRGVVNRPLLFQVFAAATVARGPLHAGELPFPAGASLGEVLAVLRTARPVSHKLTIPEGLTAAQVAALIDAADALTGDAPVPVEGSVLPETYNYERDTAREQILDRARAAMDRALDKAWEQRAPPLGLSSKGEALVLASMIERETAKPEERPLVAAVFLNRLKLGMRLQSDATVVYAASGGMGALDHAITRAALDQVAAKDGALHAFITVTADRALADARAADAAFAAGRDAGPMQGIPYALKDIYDTAGIRTTCHSKLRVDVVPETDCVVAQKLTAAGGVLIGKLATHEFAIGGPSFDLPFPPARNPWNTAHITGGSSSGSGAAVAAGMVRMAMGSDTGGSIRGPAAYCGTVGLKPTYGRVSRRGIFPLSFTLDHAGPLTRSVEDPAGHRRPRPA